MATNLIDRIPEWLKSLWHMENELRSAAQQGVFLRKDEAAAHLAEARRHLEQVMSAHQTSQSTDQGGTPPPKI